MIHPCYIIIVDWFSWEWSKKKAFLKKILKWPIQKNCVFNSTSSQYFFFRNFMNWSLGNSMLDWGEGHWCCSTYMVMSLSDINAKMAWKHKNWFFFCRLISICHNHIGWGTSRQFILLTQGPIHEIFEKKYSELNGKNSIHFCRNKFAKLQPRNSKTVGILLKVSNSCRV